MAKIMVVEDDQSLREIYSIRLTAEGFEVVSAGDGEEALAVAVKERPDLVLSDVMMPKISGFDMLDILRSTPETKDIKVIMMTALSSDDQRKRGESLGADKYLVKSQVGIEDVIAAVHEVMGGGQAPKTPEATPEAAAPAPATFEATQQPQAAPVQAEPATTPQMPEQPMPTSEQPAQPEMPVVSEAVVPPMPEQPVVPAQPTMPTQPVMPNPGEVNGAAQPGFPPAYPAQ
ncbi:response regulator [Candidatus Saccharibacteria bacterium]|nr:response regulator [Candidatus Saccharibacteria bacterium]